MNSIKSVLTVLAILMYIIGIILFFVNLFGGFSSGVMTAFCGLMVGASILTGIAKMFGNDDEGDNE